jgi:Ca2+-binding EF-hand superfamily protein
MKTTITRANFKKMLLQPEISFQNLKNDEMTNIFKVFDRQQKGSFSGEDFIFYYKQTPEYAEMDAQQ